MVFIAGMLVRRGYKSYKQSKENKQRGDRIDYNDSASTPSGRGRSGDDYYEREPESADPFDNSTVGAPQQRRETSRSAQSSAAPPPPEYHNKSLAVLELFQSQGCSSCPPANDQVLGLIESNQEILVLTYDVTYWDRLGWKDTFGDKNWDGRQWEYARALGKGNVYTPQVIVNGTADGVGASKHDLESIMKKGMAHPSGVNVTVDFKTVTVSGPAGQSATVIVVHYDPELKEVLIRSGENAKHTLPHQNVVKQVLRIGTWEGGQQAFEIPKAESWGWKSAVIVQSGPGGRILGAAKV